MQKTMLPKPLIAASLGFPLCFLAAAAFTGVPKSASDAITPAHLHDYIKVLSSDEFAGRGPGTVGEEKTVPWLVEQAKKLGLRPGNPDGTWVQHVPLYGIRTSGTIEITADGKSIPLTPRQDYILSSQNPKAAIDIADSPIVFAGYGIVAPRYHWDDYKDADVHGKTVLILSGDPPVPDPADPSKLDEKMFLGKALSIYGRPATKYETAYSKGAVAVLTVFTPRTGANNLARAAQQIPREAMILHDSTATGRIQAQASVSMEKAKELIGSETFAKDALSPSFQPMPLKATVTFHVRNALREVNSDNVVGLLPGSDPVLKSEYVVYSGHWDHLGQEADRIYHGASDNAAGTAGVLELARAFTKIKPAPRRSILFLWPTAEEKGLLGAKYYVQHPLYPLSATAADINLDYFSNWGWGRTKDISIVGIGNSTLDDFVQDAARRQGRVVTGDTAPEQGFYFRSDHLEFANGNVPSLETSPGIDFIGKPADFGTRMRDEYIRSDYHKTTDQIKPDWDLKGAVEDLRILLEVGYRVAQDEGHPSWKPDAPYH